MNLLLIVLFYSSPIECFASDNQYLKAMELKCWIDGVFLDNELMQKELGTEVVRYGVGGIARDHKEPQYITFKFYQWLLPLMVFQTFCLFLPRLVWRYQEKGTMMKLLDGICKFKFLSQSCFNKNLPLMA